MKEPGMEKFDNETGSPEEKQTLLQVISHSETLRRHSLIQKNGNNSLISSKDHNNITVDHTDRTEVTILKEEDHSKISELSKSISLEHNKKNEYNPFQHRNVKHPTNDIEALIHMLKGSLGSGVLVIPLAFQNGGLWFSLFGTIIVGVIVTYCTHVFVKCGHIICKRKRIPSVNFREIAELSFLEGPERFRKYSKLAGLVVDVSLVTETLGVGCAYIILVSRNLQQVIEYYSGEQWDLRVYMAALLPILICLNFIKDLKRLAPISMVANVLFLFGVIVSYYYIFSDLPPVSERPAFTTWRNLPTFFGTMIFALEGIGIVIPVENNMKHPENFLGCPGVLNIGMTTVIVLYTITGFFGYLKYGDDTKANITVNLPTDRILGQILKLSIAVAVFFSYCIAFYIAMSILEGRGSNVCDKSTLSYYVKRTAIVLATVIIAGLFPNLGPFLTLIGALCLSTVGLILPPVFEVLLYSRSSGFGVRCFRFWKNVAIFLFGIVGLVTGTMVGIREMIETFDTVKD